MHQSTEKLLQTANLPHHPLQLYVLKNGCTICLPAVRLSLLFVLRNVFNRLIVHLREAGVEKVTQSCFGPFYFFFSLLASCRSFDSVWGHWEDFHFYIFENGVQHIQMRLHIISAIEHYSLQEQYSKAVLTHYIWIISVITQSIAKQNINNDENRID